MSKKSTKQVHDIRLPYEECMKKTFRQIKKTKEYAVLTPLGVYNPSRAYHDGHKSTMNKVELCKALDNPKTYHAANKKLKEAKKPFGARKRNTRKGKCLVSARKIPCTGETYKHEGVTTTGERCCFKKKQTTATMEKRLRNAAKSLRASRTKQSTKQVSKKSKKQSKK